jgi:hypothetical protein
MTPYSRVGRQERFGLRKLKSLETFRLVNQFKRIGLIYPKDSGNLKAITSRHGTKFQKMWGVKPLRNLGNYYQSTRQNIPEDDGLRSSETSVTFTSLHGKTSQKKQSLLSSETSVLVTIYQCTRPTVPERHLQQHYCKNSESHFGLWPFTTPAHT